MLVSTGKSLLIACHPINTVVTVAAAAAIPVRAFTTPGFSLTKSVAHAKALVPAVAILSSAGFSSSPTAILSPSKEFLSIFTLLSVVA